MSRERMSRPSSSDPQICNSDGGASRLARLMCAGSAGAIQGAKIAQTTKNVTNTAPIAASGLLRARRGSEMAVVANLEAVSLTQKNLFAWDRRRACPTQAYFD